MTSANVSRRRVRGWKIITNGLQTEEVIKASRLRRVRNAQGRGKPSGEWFKCPRATATVKHTTIVRVCFHAPGFGSSSFPPSKRELRPQTSFPSWNLGRRKNEMRYGLGASEVGGLTPMNFRR